MRLFIFHKDLRLEDNTTLIRMFKENAVADIIPIFIFTEQQINPDQNKYFGSPCVQFMVESLLSLREDIKTHGGELYFFREEDTIKALDKIYKAVDKEITEIGWNVDYSPFALKRDESVIAWCQKKNIATVHYEDGVLHNLFDDTCKKKDGTPFKVFTPFRNYCWNNLEVRNVNKFKDFKFSKDTRLKKLVYDKLNSLYTDLPGLLVHGGRKNGMDRLKKIKLQKEYKEKRDILTYETTLLGAYISFGVLSIREVYWEVRDKLGKHSALESELYWNLFYQMIMYNFPRVIGGTFKEKWDNMSYHNNKKYVEAIMNASTGIPIIDAGLRQLYTTGFSHNRLRMVLTSFMCKHMLLDPKWVEKWWANHLVDYSVPQTNGGVAWTAGYGTDAQIASRIFNPYTQSEKFDSNAEFIKKWVPELKDVKPEHIHEWEKYRANYPNLEYSKLILIHKERREIYIKFLKENQLH